MGHTKTCILRTPFQRQRGNKRSAPRSTPAEVASGFDTRRNDHVDKDHSGARVRIRCHLRRSGVRSTKDLRPQHDAIRQLGHLDRPVLRLDHGGRDQNRDIGSWLAGGGHDLCRDQIDVKPSAQAAQNARMQTAAISFQDSRGINAASLDLLCKGEVRLAPRRHDHVHQPGDSPCCHYRCIDASRACDARSR
jgi:hypothetical protein